MQNIEKEYLSSREVAKLLSVAVSTVQLWTNSGLLRAWTTNGGHRRIARSSVEEILSKQRASLDEHRLDGQLKVLVVEDDEQQILLYEKNFIAWQMNAQLFTAMNGYEGLIKIGSTLPDVIITDLIMPEMDGFQMVRTLKEMPELANSLIIVVTGLKEDEVIERGGLPEGVHLFTKPIPFEVLENLLRQKTKTKTKAA